MVCLATVATIPASLHDRVTDRSHGFKFQLKSALYAYGPEVTMVVELKLSQANVDSYLAVDIDNSPFHKV